MDVILADKLFCEDVIRNSFYNYQKVAEKIGAKYREYAVKYHPDRRKNDQYPNPPYIKQLWLLAVSAKDVLQDTDYNVSFTKIIETYSDHRNWDRIENIENLGRVDVRIKKVRDFEEKSIEERKALVPFILKEQLNMQQIGKLKDNHVNNNGKLEKCSKGTQRNKKTGLCEPSMRSRERERQEREYQEIMRQEREYQEIRRQVRVMKNVKKGQQEIKKQGNVNRHK
jgi:hypothetical protein